VASLLALLISACTAGQGSSDAGAPLEKLSPFEVFFSDDGGMHAAHAEWQYESQLAVAGCMAEAGFTYVPQAESVPDSVAELHRLSDLE